MTVRLAVLMALLVCGALAAPADNAPNLTGTWALDAGKSHWGKHERPSSIVLKITHQEPAFKYSGQVIKAGEDPGREFSFDGAIDGKSYPAKGPGGDGTMAFKRVDGRTIESLFTSKDGTLVERSRITVSADGKRLTRDVHVKTPNAAEESWTEVYDRR